MTYQLIDAGNGKKLEQFGDYQIVRPCAQAVWKSASDWNSDATFTREKGWQGKLPDEWQITLDDLIFRLCPTDFGHLGLFPEHQQIWQWVSQNIKPGSSLLNLFAYSGGVSLAAAKAGAEVCHVDASRGMVDWARQNAKLNGLDGIRWIVDDAMKFCKRELKRGRCYDAIILDPPTFGRGAKGEVFKIEEQLVPLLDICYQLRPKFLILSCHTPGYTPLVLENLLPKGTITSGELTVGHVPSGCYARWEA